MTAAPFAFTVRPKRAHGAGVRPFVEADIPQVAAVHRAAFGVGDASLDDYAAYFTRVFLDDAVEESGIGSLVCQEPDGRITGFVGIVPRVVTLGGRRYQAAFSSQFVADPLSHVGIVALRLAKAYLEGPQDLSIADEANDVSRKIWEGLGGSTALLLSMYWTRPLRPARFGLSFLGGRKGIGVLETAGRPIAAIGDAIAARVRGSQFRLTAPATSAQPLSAAAVIANAANVHRTRPLRVEYHEQALQRVLDRTAARGRVLHAAVTSATALLGWYIAHVDDAGTAEVADLAATPATIQAVLDHLFHHAWREGAVCVTGRLDPRFVQALSDNYCVFHRRGPWVLIKAHAPELRHAIDSGNTSLSRFDGEWSLRFRPRHVETRRTS